MVVRSTGGGRINLLNTSCTIVSIYGGSVLTLDPGIVSFREAADSRKPVEGQRPTLGGMTARAAGRVTLTAGN